jgi:tRNA G46 methylase TrmB
LNRYSHKSPQQQPRQDLAEIIQTHLSAPWQRPIAAHSLEAFAAIRNRVETSTAPLMIDSCCGTGDSTRNLASAFPEALVLGIDKSEHRLARHRSGQLTSEPTSQQNSGEENYLMLRADVNDFWRLAVSAGWQPVQHFLLYPNPYPKASQFRKRWYGSPAFPFLIKLGGRLTVRTNWEIYAQEFVQALVAVGLQVSSRPFSEDKPITAFETKYMQRGDSLFEVVCDLEDFVGFPTNSSASF